MTDQDQLKLLRAGFKLIRRNIRSDDGIAKLVIEERTEKTVIWVQVKNVPGSSGIQNVENYLNDLLTDKMTVRLG